MALIAMAVYDTVENGRTEYTERVLESLLDYLDLYDHRLIVVENDSCDATKDLLFELEECFINPGDRIKVITNETNVGTAKAINQAWRLRHPGEYLIKMDNDCIVNYDGDWAGELEAAMRRDPSIGILGLKRKDLAEAPWKTDWSKSEIRMLPQQPGEPWIIVEDVHHVMGTCQMYSPQLIDRIGGLYQMDGLYGFDDSLASLRAQLAGFKTSFLPHIDIDHIDRGDTPYQKEKEQYASAMFKKYHEVVAGMKAGTFPIEFPL